jgi:hypothetical protein
MRQVGTPPRVWGIDHFGELTKMVSGRVKLKAPIQELTKWPYPLFTVAFAFINNCEIKVSLDPGYAQNAVHTACF